MDPSDFEAAARAAFEPLQYAVFFGALIALGTVESLAALGAKPLARRKRWPANAALTALNIVVIGAIPVSALTVADLAAARGWGLFNLGLVPPAVALVGGFLLRSLVSYGIHVAMHKAPLLWRAHRVHHTDTGMDVSTTVRFHPLEFLITVPIVLGATLAFGLPPLAIILYELADAGMAVFTHANVRLPGGMERTLRLILVTPAMHRIHHSASQPETDSNYGATLSCWDRLFDTYREKNDDALATLRLGLGDSSDRRAASLSWLLLLPFRRLDPRPMPGATAHITQRPAA